MEVLKGSERLFESVRPVVLCEVIPASERAVTAFLQSYDYQILDGETQGIKPEAITNGSLVYTCNPESALTGFP